MACPSCGCKETYTYDDEDYPQDGMERCAACGGIFDIEDHVGEDENMDTDQQSQPTTQQTIEPWGYAVGGNHRDVWTGRWVRAFAATEQDKAVGKALHEVVDTVHAAARVVPAEARRNRVYVAGPMSGMPGHNFPAFNAAAAALRAQGWQVENPADHGVVDGATWADYMHSDVCMLASCGAIHLLPGWSKSRGASLEAHIAASLGMQFQYAEGAEPALPMAVHEAVAIVLGELRRAMAKFPTWPTDPLHAVGVLNEEVGELNKELLQLTYEPHKVTRESVHTEAMQSAAMTLRFLASMERYEFRPCEQHVQGTAIAEGAR